MLRISQRITFKHEQHVFQRNTDTRNTHGSMSLLGTCNTPNAHVLLSAKSHDHTRARAPSLTRVLLVARETFKSSFWYLWKIGKSLHYWWMLKKKINAKIVNGVKSIIGACEPCVFQRRSFHSCAKDLVVRSADKTVEKKKNKLTKRRVRILLQRNFDWHAIIFKSFWTFSIGV